MKAVTAGLRYVSEAFMTIFRPAVADYPLIGVQAFEGEPFSQWVYSGS
jgi:hypothetical protein